MSELSTDLQDNVLNRKLDEFKAISIGILADGVINKQEAIFLHDWMLKNFNEYTLSTYPLDRIFAKLDDYLSDDILEQWEAKSLKTSIIDITGEIVS
jgi:hypothetical protein